MGQVQTHTGDTAVQNVIRDCHEVAHWASSCAVRCIESIEDEGQGMDMCARMCLDAADVAATMAALGARGSPAAGTLGPSVAKVLSDCAQHCRQHAPKAGDGRHTMENCAKACEAAVESIHAFVKTGR